MKDFTGAREYFPCALAPVITFAKSIRNSKTTSNN
jgi:hypothetical protein